MSRRHKTRKNRPRHTVFVCLFADTIHNPPAHHIMPPKKKGGGTTTPAAAASADDIDDIDDFDDDEVSYPIMSKKAFLAKAGANAAGVANIERYFGASGAATTRATILPWLSIFQLHQGLANDMGRKSAAPATVSVPTALVAAAAGRAEAGKAASDVMTAAAASVLTALEDDGELLGSMFDLPDDITFSGGGDMCVENEGVEEDAGVDGAELAALTSVFDCDHIKRKNMNDKDG